MVQELTTENAHWVSSAQPVSTAARADLPSDPLMSETINCGGIDPSASPLSTVASLCLTGISATLNDSGEFATAIGGTIVVAEGDARSDLDLPFLEGPLGEPPRMTRLVLVRVAVLTLIGGVSFIANVMALASIFRMRQRRMSSHSSTLYTLLAHMAVADLLVTSFCIVAEAAWTYTIEWLADDITCKAVKYAQVFALYLSTFILIVLALDQLLIVRYPLRKDANIVLIKRAVIAAWILAAFLSLPQVFIFSVLKGPFNVEFYQCVTYAFYTAPWQEQLYASVSLVLMFVLPLTTLVVTYAATFCTIANLPAIHCNEMVAAQQQQRAHIHRLSTQSSKVTRFTNVTLSRGSTNSMQTRATCSHPMEAARRRLLAKAKKKSLMITVVIVVAFIVCWTPYYVMMVIFIFNLDPDQKITGELQSAIFFFGSSTAMINPVIYGAFHLRRPRDAKLQHSTVVLSSASFRRAQTDNHNAITPLNAGLPKSQINNHAIKHNCVTTTTTNNRSYDAARNDTYHHRHQQTANSHKLAAKVQIEVRIEPD